MAQLLPAMPSQGSGQSLWKSTWPRRDTHGPHGAKVNVEINQGRDVEDHPKVWIPHPAAVQSIHKGFEANGTDATSRVVSAASTS